MKRSVTVWVGVAAFVAAAVAIVFLVAPQTFNGLGLRESADGPSSAGRGAAIGQASRESKSGKRGQEGAVTPKTASSGGKGADAGDIDGDGIPETGSSETRSEMPGPGEPLAKVETPPAKTVMSTKKSSGYNKGLYDVVFQPYGTGPDVLGAPTVAIKLISSTTVGGGDAPALGSQNLLVTPSPSAAAAVNVGGKYQGQVRFVAKGDRLYPVLEAARLIK